MTLTGKERVPERVGDWDGWVVSSEVRRAVVSWAELVALGPRRSAGHWGEGGSGFASEAGTGKGWRLVAGSGAEGWDFSVDADLHVPDGVVSAILEAFSFGPVVDGDDDCEGEHH